MLFYIYAVAGVHLFGAGSPEYFRDLPTALLTLFRVVMLDSWGDMFVAQLAHAPGLKVTFYFVTFIVFGTMITLNLFIGIIMNSMSEMHEEIAARESAAGKPDGGVPQAMRELETELDEIKQRAARLRQRIESE